MSVPRARQCWPVLCNVCDSHCPCSESRADGGCELSQVTGWLHCPDLNLPQPPRAPAKAKPLIPVLVKWGQTGGRCTGHDRLPPSLAALLRQGLLLFTHWKTRCAWKSLCMPQPAEEALEPSGLAVRNPCGGGTSACLPVLSNQNGTTQRMITQCGQVCFSPNRLPCVRTDANMRPMHF